MKYYSEQLNKFYDSPEACQDAEFKAKEEANLAKIKRERELAYQKEQKEKLAAERKERAAVVENARKNMVEAQKKYRDEITKFIKDYGTYHYTSSSEDDIPTLFSFFDNLFF